MGFEMTRMFKNFAKKFMHREGSSCGDDGGSGGRRGEENVIVPFGYEHGLEDLLEATENIENASDEVGVDGSGKVDGVVEAAEVVGRVEVVGDWSNFLLGLLS